MRYPISLSLLVLAFIANARQITPEEAQAVAQDFFNNSSVEQSRAPRAIRARALNSAPLEGNAPYYIFNASDNKGFVIISGDDRAKKILGYSDNGNFDLTNMPPQLNFILSQYKTQIEKVSSENIINKTYEADESTSQNVVLETALYHQGYPFNLYTPLYDDIHYPTGCVATAMAIIMKYHNWPNQSIGNTFFNQTSWQDEPHDFNTTYDWDNILSDYSSSENELSNKAVAKLVNEIAIAVGTEYLRLNGGLAAGAYTFTIGRTFDRIFRYSGSSHVVTWKKELTDLTNGNVSVFESYFSDNEWYAMIKNEINSNRPIFYSAYDDFSSHAFVIDGYDDFDRFHINWGWGGSNNGFFALTALLPNYDGIPQFIYGHEMYLGIKPENARPGQISKIYFANTETAGLFYNSIKIEPNKPTTFTLSETVYRMNGNYEFGVALKDDNNNTVEIKPLMNPISFENSKIQNSWTVQAVYREDDGEWIEIPSPNETDHRSVIQQLPIINISIANGLSAYTGGFYPGAEWQEYTGDITLTAEPAREFNILTPNNKNGRTRVRINGKELGQSHSFYRSVDIISSSTNESIKETDFIITNPIVLPEREYNITIDEISYSNLSEESIVLHNPEELICDMIPQSKLNNTWKLALAGELSPKNLSFITNSFPNVYKLDLSKVPASCNWTHLVYGFGTNVMQHSLRELILPNSVEVIYSNTFLGMDRLEKIHIPSTIKEIYSGAINDCRFLTDIYIESQNPPQIIGENSIVDYGRLLTIHVPIGSKALYEKDSGWGKIYAKFVEYDPAGILDVTIDNSNEEVSIFNIQGVLIYKGKSDSNVKLPHGIYIIRKGNHSYKCKL